MIKQQNCEATTITTFRTLYLGERHEVIRIFYPDGIYSGVRVAQMSFLTVLAIEVPRESLAVFFKIPESQRSAHYILFNAANEGSKAKVYVGQAEAGHLPEQLNAHSKDLEFWQTAIIFTSSNADSSLPDALRSIFINEINKAGKYSVVKDNSLSLPEHSDIELAEGKGFYQVAHRLLKNLNCPVFQRR